MDVAAPAEEPEAAPASPFPSSWTAQPPKVFQAPEAETSSGRGFPLTALLLVVGLGIGFAAGYALKSRPDNPAAKVSTPSTPVPAKSAPMPVPAESSLPSPMPSRPASGAAAAAPLRPPPVGPPPVRPTVAAGRGRLLIRSTPADASVIVNGQARGKTPLTVRDLPLGSYTIRIVRDGFAVEDRQVRLTAKHSSASIAIPLKPAAVKNAGGVGSISVDSRPPGARVYVNDRLIGSTPLALPGLPAGPATVRIEMDGYQTWATTVRVVGGEQTRVAASLDRKR